MTDRRESIRSNAKYLRNVRPVDPEEICEYVEGSPHPAVVRQTLREEAVDLGLIERDDGTFVPVDDEPIAPLEVIRAFPADYERRLEDLLADRYGPRWYDGGSGDLLRSTIRRFKADYLEGVRSSTTTTSPRGTRSTTCRGTTPRFSTPSTTSRARSAGPAPSGPRRRCRRRRSRARTLRVPARRCAL